MIHDTCCRCCCSRWWWWWWWWWRHNSISWKRIRWSLQHLNAQQISFNQSLDQTISIGRRELLPTYGTMDAHGLMDMKTYEFFWQVSIERTWQYLTTFWRKWCLNNVMLIFWNLQKQGVRLISGMWLYLYTSDGHLLHEVAIWWNTTQTAATWGYACIADFHCISMHYHLETPKPSAKTLCKQHAVAPCQDSTHLRQLGYHQDLEMSCLECAIWELFRAVPRAKKALQMYGYQLNLIAYDFIVSCNIIKINEDSTWSHKCQNYNYHHLKNIGLKLIKVTSSLFTFEQFPCRISSLTIPTTFFGHPPRTSKRCRARSFDSGSLAEAVRGNNRTMIYSIVMYFVDETLWIQVAARSALRVQFGR